MVALVIPSDVVSAGALLGLFAVLFLPYLGMVAVTYWDARENSSAPAVFWAAVVAVGMVLGLALYWEIGRDELERERDEVE